jgi:hypothetical protein
MFDFVWQIVSGAVDLASKLGSAMGAIALLCLFLVIMKSVGKAVWCLACLCWYSLGLLVICPLQGVPYPWTARGREYYKRLTTEDDSAQEKPLPSHGFYVIPGEFGPAGEAALRGGASTSPSQSDVSSGPASIEQ